jgi:hypothetical protein
MMRNFSTRIMMKVKLGAYLILITLLASLPCYSQTSTATATIDTNSITIGEQFKLSLKFSHPAKATAEWPLVPDTFSLMEVVQRMPVDTSKETSANDLVRSQDIILTSFDSGFHVIPPFVFTYRLKGDTTLFTASTEPLLITVNTIPVDTTRAIKDIKGQIAIPFSWQDALPYIFGVAIVALLAFLIYRFIKMRKAKVITPEIKIPKRPAHEIALEELKALDMAKLWQNGNFKAYYTGLSDITRTFIENRWSVMAMEMTTEEIMKLKIISDQNGEILSKLKFMLELSDLVKFAKAIPVVYENEQCLSNAFAFVEANKTVQQEKEVEQ